MRMVIIGPPGSGKGTQTARISSHLGVPAISTGDIFRDNVKKLTSLGLQAKKYLDNGDFVPDEITNDMIRDRLSWDDARTGFLLDGYPRTRGQVDYLDVILTARGLELDVVLQLRVQDEEITSRLLARADDSGRTDDNEAVIKHRLDLYHRQTELVVACYYERGRLLQIDGAGAVSEVTERALHALNTLQPCGKPFLSSTRT
jgi:adenylate kinase